MLTLIAWRIVYTLLGATGASLIYMSIRSDAAVPDNGVVPFIVGIVCIILCSFMWRRVYR